jgi:ATP-binding cassette subfamily B protein
MDQNLSARLKLGQLKKYASSTLRGLGLAWRASPRLGIAITALTAVSSVLPPLMAFVGKLIIDAVIAKSQDQVIHMVLAEFALIAAVTIVQRTLFLCRTLLGNRLGIDVNAMILQKSISLDLAQIENSEFYDKLTRARRDASSRSLQMVTDTFQFFQNTLTFWLYDIATFI